jgi:surfeit locus 1 family protein
MLAALVVLLGLGTWQLQRKAWKERLLADIAARTTAPPISLDAARRRWQTGEGLEYTRVAVSGRFLYDKECFVYAPGSAGPGYDVYTPLETAGGAIVFVNRGFVPEALRELARRRGGSPDGEVKVEGLLRRAPSRNWFSPDQGTDRSLWFWRDLEGMTASAFGGSGRQVVPFFLDAVRREGADWPRGGATRLELPNRHLEYAVTWYGLALTLIGVYFFFIWGRLRP